MTRTASIVCASCSCTHVDKIKEGETFFEANARLRAQLADKCPREHSAVRVAFPMRGETSRDRTPSVGM